MINSNDIKEKIVTSDFLKYLLQPHELPDFILTNISTIYIYMNYPEKPFASACDKIMNLLQQYKENGQFCSVLKSLGNLYCGLMGVTARYPNVHLLKSTDFEALKQMKYFLSSQSLGNDVYLAKFWSNDKSKNHLQNHFAKRPGDFYQVSHFYMHLFRLHLGLL